MKRNDFESQIARLQARFGEKSFDSEFTRLIAAECQEMVEADFVRLVDFFIGTRPPTRPPLLPDFTEGRLNAEKRKFNREVDGAAKSFSSGRSGRPMEQILAKDFPGCKTVKEALAVAVHRERIKLAEEAARNGEVFTPKAAKPIKEANRNVEISNQDDDWSDFTG